MTLKPPADPCMCGSFSVWHGACYVGLSQSEIDRRHRDFVARWKHIARTRLFAKTMRSSSTRTKA